MASPRTLGFFALSLVACFGKFAHADEDPNGRGVIGGALVGAELALIGEAAFRVEPSWAYALGGALGAGGGAYVGYVVEENAEREASLILLAAGVGLVIPTVVFVGNRTASRPPASDGARLMPPRARVTKQGIAFELLRGQF